jgi:hypothetical protein
MMKKFRQSKDDSEDDGDDDDFATNTTRKWNMITCKYKIPNMTSGTTLLNWTNGDTIMPI